MQNEEQPYIPTYRASRPPQEDKMDARSVPVYTELPFRAPNRSAGASRSGAEFTDITPRTPRVPNNGRPSAAYYETGYHPGEKRDARRPAGRVPEPTYETPPRPASANYGGSTQRPVPNTTPRPRPNTPRPAATFTEISWDSLRDPASLTRETPPQTPAQPPRSASFSQRASVPTYTQYDARDRRGTPIHEGFDAEWAHGIPERPVDRATGYSSTPRRSPTSAGSFDDFYRREVQRGQETVPPATSRRPAQPTPRPAAPKQTTPRTVVPRPGAPRVNSERTPAAPIRNQPSLRLSKIRLPELKNPFAGGNAAEKEGVAAPRRHGAAKRGGPSPIFMIAALVAVALLIFVVAKIAAGKQNHTEDRTPSHSTGVPVYVPPGEQGQAVVSDPTKEPDPEKTPLPTVAPSPSPTPSGEKAVRKDGRIVPADWGPVVISRSKAVHDSHFDNACMIGNSLVEGFCMWSDMNNIKYIYNTGATATAALGTLDLAPVTMNPGKFDSVYLLFGLNEIGVDVTSFITSYQKIIDYIYQYQPSTTIYVISVTPVTKMVDENPDEVQSMERIKLFNEALKGMCQESGCWYLDIYSLLLDGEGYLSEEYAYAGDGKHFEKSGYKAWAEYMHTHYVDSGLVN